MALEVGIFLRTVGYNSNNELLDPSFCAHRIEDLEFDGIWVGDQLVAGSGAPVLDSTVALSVAAATTRRVSVGFGVLIVALRRAVWVAKQLASLQSISRNRLHVGVGVGGASHGSSSFDALGMPATDRWNRTDDVLNDLEGLLSGRPTMLLSEASRPIVTLAPAVPVPPILIGGTSASALHRVLSRGYGWMPNTLNPEMLRTRLKHLSNLAEDQRVPMPRVTVVVAGALGAKGVPSRHELVNEILKRHKGLISEVDIASMPLTGSPLESAAQLRAYWEAGAHHVAVLPYGADWIRQCELLGEARRLALSD